MRKNAQVSEAGKFKWTGKREKAAVAIALDQEGDATIAKEVGVSRRTLVLWKTHPDFAARVQSLVNEFRAEVRKVGLAVLENRVAALNDRWQRMDQLIQARANDPAMDGVPGGNTGLLVRRVRPIGSGTNFEIEYEYEFDSALVKELREHEKQAAQELGQWVERKEVEQVQKEYVVLGPEDL